MAADSSPVQVLVAVSALLLASAVVQQWLWQSSIEPLWSVLPVAASLSVTVICLRATYFDKNIF